MKKKQLRKYIIIVGTLIIVLYAGFMVYRLKGKNASKDRGGAKPDYHLVGCGIIETPSDGFAKEYFYVTDPQIYHKKDPIDYFEVDDSGKITKLVSKEVNYSINTWLFDSEGRPALLWHNGSYEKDNYTVDYQYGDEGRAIRLTTKNWEGRVSFKDIVYGEEKKKTIRYYDENGRIYREGEYNGEQLVRELRYDEEGNVIEEKKQ